MADISASDVSYSVDVRQSEVEDSIKRVPLSISFGDGVLTYPAGGVPLTLGAMGPFRSEIQALVLDDPASGDGYVYKFDKAALTVRIYQGDNNNAADSPLIELVAATATPPATTLKGIALGR